MDSQNHCCFYCYQRPRESCIYLKGTLVIHNIFVNVWSDQWDEREMSQVIKAIREAGRWVEREAIRYSVNLKIKVSDNVLFVKNGSFPADHNDTHERIFNWASNILKKAQFEDIQHYVHTLQMAEKADNWATIFHVKAAGRSYAFPAWSDNPIEFVVCFMDYSELTDRITSKTWTPDARLYAHEILHLFDAKDKYVNPSEFPASDIMNQMYHFNLETLRVTDATARELKWVNP